MVVVQGFCVFKATELLKKNITKTVSISYSIRTMYVYKAGISISLFITAVVKATSFKSFATAIRLVT